MRIPLVAAMVLLTLSLGSCAWLAMTRPQTVPPAEVPEIGAAAMDRAAAAASGQRLLALVMRPGVAPRGRILQSAKVAEGWRAFPATPDAANPLVPALDALAAAAGADFAPDESFDAQTVRALQLFGVAVVVVSRGDGVVAPSADERDPNVVVAPEVPALRLRHTNPVFLFLADDAAHDAADPVGFVRALRYGDAQFQDDEYSQWGGAVTIDAAGEGRFLFPWTAAGARVTLDGAPVAASAAGLPMLVVRVPAGRHRVVVEYGEPHTARNAFAIAATAGAVIAFVMLWLGLRPHPERTADA